jgi:ribosomal protein L19E
MAQKKKWCKTLREARKLLKKYQATDPTGHMLRVYKVKGKYLVGDHWTWLLAVS